MTPWLLPVLTLITALGCGLIGGVFFAFSSFVMKALGRLPPSQGLTAMQSVNVVVLTPLFLTAFLGTALGCLALGISSFLVEPGSNVSLVRIGAICYVIGTFGVTVTCNVPRNEALASLDPANPDSAAHWARYLRSWTIWNHVRTGAALAAAAVLSLALWLS